MLAPLVVDLGGMLRGEAVDQGHRGYEALWFLDGLGESLKLAEVDSWMAEHFFPWDVYGKDSWNGEQEGFSFWWMFQRVSIQSRD